MEDIQMGPSTVPLDIDRVGIQNLSMPIVVRDRALGSQSTVAQVSLGVELPSSFKGTHMSRFVEALEGWGETLNYQSMKRLLEDVKKRLQACKASISFAFPYFIRKNSPSSKASGLMSYKCKLTGEMEGEENSINKPTFVLEVEVPVMTVCPCSKAISKEGAHSQRTLIHIKVKMRSFFWIEELVEIAEASGSSPLYSLLKREDEKYVTEDAFANPAFVEDVVRAAALRLREHEQVAWFRVQVRSMESIHNHEAFACIESTN